MKLAFLNLYMHNLINKYLPFIPIFFFSYLFFIPCNFFIIQNYYYCSIILCISILFFYLLDNTKKALNTIDISNKGEEYQKKIIFFSSYFFLLLKQFFITYSVYKIALIYAPKITILYIQIILLFLYNIFFIITDDKQNNFLAIIIECLTCTLFLFIILLEYNISYELFESYYTTNNYNFIHWIYYFTPFFLFYFNTYENYENKLVKYTNLTVLKVFIFIIVIYLKNKLYIFLFTKNDLFANIIIKNYTICPFLIHIFYFFLLCYIWNKGYQTYQKQLSFQENHTHKVILIINTIIFASVLSNHLISLKMIIITIYLFIFIKYLLYSIIIYKIKKKFSYLLFYFLILASSLFLLLK